MNSRRKLILLILVTFFILFILGTSYYLFFRENNESALPQETGEEQFFPFGEPAGEFTPTRHELSPGLSGSSSVNAQEEDLRYYEIARDPVAGAGWGTITILRQEPVENATSSDATEVQEIEESTIRYMDRSTGHIYEVRMDSLERSRISNTTIPKVQEALWAFGGKTLIARLLNNEKEIESYHITIERNQNSEYTTNFTPLINNIASVSFAPFTSDFVYLTKIPGVQGGQILLNENGSARLLRSIEFDEFNIDWKSEGQVDLLTKPSSGVKGLLYNLSLNGGITKTLDEIRGLTTLRSPNGKYILYSENTGTSFSLKLLNGETGTSSQLPMATLPEKCVWGANEQIIYCAVPSTFESGSYPDVWYQGKVSFSDRFMEFDVESFDSRVIVDPANYNQRPVDAINLSLSPDGSKILFMNKKDFSLWAFELSE